RERHNRRTMLTTTATYPMTGRRYITIEDSDEHGTHWVLFVDGELIARAAMRSYEPPFALTEGLPFVPQYESHVDEVEGTPTSWFYAPPPPASRGFWFGVGVALAFGLTSLATHPAVALPGALILFVVAALEANK